MSALDPISPQDCAFCKIARGELPATIVAEWDDAIAFVPLNPVTGDQEELGHVLVIPREHVIDFMESDKATVVVALRVAELGRWIREETRGDLSRITSAGEWATQTVPHYHEHLVIRRADDGLHLPWTGQERSHA